MKNTETEKRELLNQLSSTDKIEPILQKVKTIESKLKEIKIWDLDEKDNNTAINYCKKYQGAPNETRFKVGDKITFYTGYNDDILASATIKGINQHDIYVYSDCYWFPIQDDERRKIKIINNL